MEPPAARPSTSPRPKKKFSLRNLRARFGSTSNVDLSEDLTAAAEWNKLSTKTPDSGYSYETITPYPYSPSTQSSATSSPTTSSYSSSRERQKSLPHVPPIPTRPPSNSTVPPKRKSPATLSLSDETHSTNATTTSSQYSKADPQPVPEDYSDLPWTSKTRSPEYVSLADGHTRQEQQTSASHTLLNSITSNGV